MLVIREASLVIVNNNAKNIACNFIALPMTIIRRSIYPVITYDTGDES
jgi:hypothetical protein